MFEDTFLTIAAPSEGLYKEKGSRFIALAFPVEREEDVKAILAELRKTYHDARHHCYAYVLGADKSAYRINDDGEPSGTAGKPIHGQILSADLTNILIVVIRYFGGVLLGVSGLIRSYRLAAKDAIEHAKIIEKTVDEVYTVLFPYESMNDVMKCLKDNNAAFIDQNFDLSCAVTFSVRRNSADAIHKSFELFKGVKIKYEKTI